MVQTPLKLHEKTSRERKREWKFGREKEKKREMLGGAVEEWSAGSAESGRTKDLTPI